MPTSEENSILGKLLDRESELKGKIHFYLFSASIMTILLPPEYNNPFLLLVGINSIFSKTLLKDFIGALKNPAVYIPLIFWLVYYLSTFYSQNESMAFKEVNKMAALGFFPLVLSLSPALDRFKIEKLKWHFVISVTVLCLYSIIYSFSGMFSQGQFIFSWVALSYENLVSGVGVQPLYLSMFIALALFFLFEMQRKYKTGIVQILIIVFLFLYMIMLSTRMTTLAFFVIFSLYTVLTALRNKKYLYQGLSFSFFLVTAIVIIVLNPVNKKRFEEALNPNSSYQTDQYGGRSIRLEKWKCSIAVFSESPFFGVGAGDLRDELMECYTERSIDAALFHQFNSHNQYLNTLGQTGLFGFFVMTALLAFAVKEALKRNDDIYLIFLLLFAMCIVSESMFERRWGIFFFTLFYSFFQFNSHKNYELSLIYWLKQKMGK